MMSLFFVNASHSGQKPLIVFTFGESDDFPRAQKSAFGGDIESLLPLHVGQAPQYLCKSAGSQQYHPRFLLSPVFSWYSSLKKY